MTRKVLNLGKILADTAARFPEHVGIVQGARRLDWRTINARVDAAAHAFAAAGVGKGDAILVHSRNSIMMFESLWTAFKLGAVWVPTNFRLTPREVRHMAETSRARAMVCDAGFSAHVDEARQARDLALVLRAGEARAGERDYEEVVA
ncbi:MAG: AMP-binding protein, partial [Parvularculaceae bacterium]|nr:AMP-binding protein [Parvularculaceae bacterium]